MFKTTLAALMVALLSLPLTGQQLFADLNQSTAGSEPQGLLANDRYHAFFASPDGEAYFLYVQDRIALTVDVFPGNPTGGWDEVQDQALIRDQLYFSTIDRDAGVQTFHRLDLTSGSINTILTVAGLPASPTGNSFTAHGTPEGTVFFVTSSGSRLSIYQTDGTEAGTERRGSPRGDVVSVALESIGEHLFVTNSSSSFNGDVEVTLEVLSDSGLEEVFINRSRLEELRLIVVDDQIFAIGKQDDFEYYYLVDPAALEATDLSDSLDPQNPSSGLTFAYVNGADLVFIERTSGRSLGLVSSSAPFNSVTSIIDFTAAGIEDEVTKIIYDPDEQLAYFIGTTFGSTVARLYRTDFSTSGTFLLTDFIVPDGVTGRPLPPDLHMVAGRVYFTADDFPFGNELYVSDGTTMGTGILKEIRPGSAGADIQNITLSENSLMFSANGPGIGREVYVSDGTAEGTGYLLDVNESSAGSFPSGLFSTGDSLYFGVETGCGDLGYAVTAGEAGTTRIIGEPARFEQGSRYVGGTLVGGLVYHTVAFDAVVRTDGTAAGTREVITNQMGIRESSVSTPGRAGDIVLVVAFLDGFEGVRGHSLIGYNPATDSVSVLQNISNSGSYSALPVFYPLNESLTLFYDRSNRTQPIYITDGTSGGTINLDLFSRSSYQFANVFAEEGQAVIRANSGSSADIYYTDGTQNGTEILLRGLTGATNIIKFQGAPHFIARSGSTYILYRVDLTARSVSEVLSMTPDFTFVNEIVALDDQILFSASTQAEGRELWRVTPTEDAVLIRDIAPGEASAFPSELTVLNNQLYFTASRPDFIGKELFVTDGSGAGTMQLRTLTGSTTGRFPQELTVHADKLFFQAEDETAGTELFVYDPASPTGSTGNEDGNIGLAHCGPTNAPVSLDEQQLEATLGVYPNPADEGIRIVYEDRLGPLRSTLFTVSGKRILHQDIMNGSWLDLSELPTGMYTLRLEFTAGGGSVHRRVVVR